MKTAEEEINMKKYFEDMNFTLDECASIFLEELNVSGDTMVGLDHGEIPEEQKGAAYYLYDLMEMFAKQYADYHHKQKLAEVMPSDDDIIAEAESVSFDTPFSEIWRGFVKGAKWMRSKL